MLVVLFYLLHHNADFITNFLSSNVSYGTGVVQIEVLPTVHDLILVLNF